MKARIEFSWNHNHNPPTPWGSLYIDSKYIIGVQGESFDAVEKELLQRARECRPTPPAKEYEVQVPGNNEPVTLTEVLDHFNRTLR